MFPITLTKALASASANNIALSQTPLSGAALAINGALAANGVATLDTQRRVLFTFGNEGSDRTVVITGTNMFGAVISETVAIPAGAGSTAYTINDYLTVTSLLTGGGAWTHAVTVGTNGIGSTQWVSSNTQVTPGNTSILAVTVSGSVTSTLEWTNDPLCPIGNIPWYVPSATVLTLSSGNATITWPITGWRMTITTGTGTARMTGAQGGVSQGG